MYVCVESRWCYRCAKEELEGEDGEMRVCSTTYSKNIDTLFYTLVIVLGASKRGSGYFFLTKGRFKDGYWRAFYLGVSTIFVV